MQNLNTVMIHRSRLVAPKPLIIVMMLAVIPGVVACGAKPYAKNIPSSQVNVSNTSQVNNTSNLSASSINSPGINLSGASSQRSSSGSADPKLGSVDMTTLKDGFATGQVNGKFGLWFTKYGGMVWARVQLPSLVTSESTSSADDGVATSTVGSNTLFIAKSTSSGVQTYVTKDDGKTWEKLGLANTGDTMISMFHFVNASDGWILTDNGVAAHQAQYHLFRTTDGGKSWSLISQTQKSTLVGHVPGYGDGYFTFDTSGNGWMTGQGVVAGKGVLMHSQDGGRTWKSLTVPVPKAYSRALVTTSKPVYDHGHVVIVVQYQTKNHDSAVVLHLNSQGRILSTSAPLHTTKPLATDFVNSTDGWATDASFVSSHAKLYHTVNGGQTWNSVNVSQQMAQGNPHFQFILPSEGFVFKSPFGRGSNMYWRTTDGGQHWHAQMIKIYAKGGPTPPTEHQTPPPPVFTPTQIDFVSRNVGFLVASYGNGQKDIGRVYKTKDAGKTWTEIYGSTHSGHVVASIDARGQHVWISVLQSRRSSVPKGTVLFSNDGGLHFKTVNASALANIDFVSQTDGWATTVSNQFSNKLLHTSDGGRTWKTTSDLPKRSTSAKEQQPYEGSPVSVSFADPKHGMVLRTGQPGVGQQPKTLTSTSNGGKTWSIISSVAMDGKGQTNPHQLSSGGYAKGIDTVPGHPKTAYIWESRGPLLKSTDGGQTWSASKLTPPAEIEAASVSMINKRIGYVLVHDMLPHQHRFILERTTDSMKSWTKIHHWQ